MLVLATVAFLAGLGCAAGLGRVQARRGSERERAAGETSASGPHDPASRARGTVAESLSERLSGTAPGAVAIAEIDRFHALRRRIGYPLASDLMAGLSTRLQNELEGCRIGRVGRTTIEFAFDAESADAAEAKLRALATALEQHVELEGQGFDLSVTIGAAMTGAAPIDDRLLDDAAVALEEARKRRAKVRIAKAAGPDDDLYDHLAIVRDLHRAMRDGGLELHYQPKLRSRTDKLIDIAEDTGAIRELTHWVIDRALADQARLAQAGHDIVFFVNISGVLLPDKAFADWALARLADAGGRIGFEVTETAVIEDPADAIANLQRFADAGLKIAIDDYGSGLSSLAYLKQLPAHELKIDRMFVSNLAESHRDPLLVRSSIDLAHALEMEVTAEGVDDPLALSLLRVMGCDMIQGYLISPPLPLPELERFLAEGGHRERLTSRSSSLDGWALAPGR